MIERHLSKLKARHALSPEEERIVRDLVGDHRDFPAGATAIRQGERLEQSTLLLDGLMARSKGLEDGRAQVTELHVPGDFADLHSFTLKRLEHDVVTLTACRAALVPHERLTALMRDHPRLTWIYWFQTNLDAAIHREWVLSLGRRSAVARMAHLFCELEARLAIVGLADGARFALPITQAQLAECLGLSPVHVNRTLMDLRDRGLAEFKDGEVTIRNRAGLERTAEFDPAYLYLNA